MTRQEKTKRLTVSAMLSALGVIFLWLGSAVEVVDISMAAIASLLCVIAVIEYGGSAPWLIFGATATLSLLLLPQKTPAVMYLVFFGYYPILKEKLERRSKLTAWIFKEIIFNAALAILLVASHYLLLVSIPVESVILYYGALVVMAEIAFPLYDVALTRLISFYLFRLRKRFRF